MIEFERKIRMRRPDDWHLHLRDGNILNSVVAHTARTFRRAVIMPNLQPPITDIQKAIDYRQRILDAIPDGLSFTPLMTAYLTDDLMPNVLEKGFREGVFFAAKLYPANSTTNSAFGVTNIEKIYSTVEIMEKIGLPLLIHGEVSDPHVDVFDREAVFIERHLDPLLKRFQNLQVVLEHITTKDAVQYVQNSQSRLAATITPHHLHINRNAMFKGGLRSDYFCLPVAKREYHRVALRQAAVSGEPCFFLGTDSAPHLRQFKESSCGCAGIFNAPYAIESYAQVFDEEGAIDRLEPFASEFGPAFYGLPLNEDHIILVQRPQLVQDRIEIQNFDQGKDYIVPFHAGETLRWSIQV